MHGRYCPPLPLPPVGLHHPKRRYVVFSVRAAFFFLGIALGVCFCRFSYNRSRAGNNQFPYNQYLSGVISDSSSKLWKVRDCHTPWNKNAAAAATLRADCNLRINSISTLRYAYPKIECGLLAPKRLRPPLINGKPLIPARLMPWENCGRRLNPQKMDA